MLQVRSCALVYNQQAISTQLHKSDIACVWTSQVALKVKKPRTSAGDKRDVGVIPQWGRSPGRKHGNPGQDSDLKNPHGQKSLVGYSLYDFKELDMTEMT